MKIGIRIPCYRKWCRREETRTIAMRGEALGYDSLWVQDHLVAPMGPPEEIAVLGTSDFTSDSKTPADSKPKTVFEYYAIDDWWLDPYIVWGFIAAITTKVMLTSDVLVVPYRNPLVQAKMIGTLDVLSNGRMMLGTGIGHVAAESKALGLDFSARGRMHDEFVKIIRAMLSNEETSFQGEFYSFGPLRTLIRPVQKPCPPIYCGGNGPRAIRRAVELGDGWIPNSPDVAGLARAIDLMKDACKTYGRAVPPPIAISLPGRFRLASPLARPGKQPLMSADETIAVLREYEKLGVEHVGLGFLMPNLEVYMDQVEFFAAHVLPAFR